MPSKHQRRCQRLARKRRFVKLHNKMREFYEFGLSDYDIADLVCVHQTTVMRWRNKEGLPVNARKHIKTIDDEEDSG